MTATMSFPVFIPVLQPLWGLSNAEAGWVSGIFYLGYVMAVAVLVPLTDRVEARRIYLAGALIAALSAAGFAFFADGFWSACLWRVTAGIGLAGTYMPGLKALTDALDGSHATRPQSFYTAFFSVGASLSVLFTGLLADVLAWQLVFLVLAAGPALAGFMVWFAVPPAGRPAAPTLPRRALFDFMPVFRNRAAMGYVLGYAAHGWELFAFRSWIVAFLAFNAGLSGGGISTGAITTVATVALLLGLPASLLGNELSLVFGRRRYLITVMLCSGLAAGVLAFAVAAPFAAVVVLVSIYGALVMADSASLTVGAINAATPADRGATMAVHSFLGFGGAFLGPLVFGLALDLGGGEGNAAGWTAAFLTLGLAVALGPAALSRFRGPADD